MTLAVELGQSLSARSHFRGTPANQRWPSFQVPLRESKMRVQAVNGFGRLGDLERNCFSVGYDFTDLMQELIQR
jgi:hypothetical protein